MFKKLFITGCLAGASFFIGCQNLTPQKEAATTEEPEMYEASELAVLMRDMYEGNLELKEQIIAGELPGSFPEEFYKIHTAEATEPEKINNTYKALADEYLKNMERIAKAQNTQEAKIAYNDMVMTCASCHQIYCQGPLPKIRRMKIKMDD